MSEEVCSAEAAQMSAESDNRRGGSEGVYYYILN